MIIGLAFRHGDLRPFPSDLVAHVECAALLDVGTSHPPNMPRCTSFRNSISSAEY